ncbi:MAG: polysaccharide deacetylase family protein [Austwickia sp.]|nr:MAG: polysaccharide deacetylase family protein [Austwickia sp.]
MPPQTALVTSRRTSRRADRRRTAGRDDRSGTAARPPRRRGGRLGLVLSLTLALCVAGLAGCAGEPSSGSSDPSSGAADAAGGTGASGSGASRAADAGPTPTTPAVTRPTQATVTVYGPDVDAPGALLPMVVTAHGTTEQEGVEFAVAVAGQAGTCEGPKWRHADGLSQKCWVTLPAAPGKTQVTATARLSGPGWVAQAAGGTYGVAATGPPAIAPSREERDRTRRCGNTTDEVWLTFDDGFESAAALHAVVDRLTAAGVRGRFFAVGTWARSNPALVAEIRRQGHLVENHSGSHQWLNTLGDAALRTEIANGPAADEPRLLRPGYGGGVFTNRVRDAAAELGLGLCFWTVDPRDWAGPTADVITSRVLVGDAKTPPVAAGGIVLFHMTGAHTAEALPRVIEGIRAKGLTLAALR